jgi:hypothetical protein
MQLKKKMSVNSLSYKVGANYLEEKCAPCFDELRNQYSDFVDKVMNGEHSLGPGRLFYESPFARSHGQRFQYALVKSIVEDIYEADVFYNNVLCKVGEKLPPININNGYYNKDDVRHGFEILFSQASIQYDFLISLLKNDIFPMNLYDSSIKVTDNVRRTVLYQLRKTCLAVEILNENNLAGNTTSFPISINNNTNNIVSTCYSVVEQLESLAWDFSNNFGYFKSSEEKSISRLGSVYKKYATDLKLYNDSFSEIGDYREEVSIFNMIGPFAFLETILTLTKHAAELRANTYIAKSMFENRLTK